MRVTARVNVELSKSANYIPMGFWRQPDGSALKPYYRITDLGIPMVKRPAGTSLGYTVWVLNTDVSNASAPDASGNTQWKLIDSLDIIYAQNAYIERLQAALITAEYIEALMIRTSNIEILEGAVVGGTLKAVSGSFKSLNAIDSDGNIVGSIRFGTDGCLWFEGDMQHQGYNSTENRSWRFLTSDLWCRGVFGSNSRATAVVMQNVIWYFPNGLSKPSTNTIILQSNSISGGGTYYTIPTTHSAVPGFNTDIVLVQSSPNYNYMLSAVKGKPVKVINIHNADGVGFNIMCNGIKHNMKGGQAAEYFFAGDLLQPYNSTNIGAGWIKLSYHDDDWT